MPGPVTNGAETPNRSTPGMMRQQKCGPTPFWEREKGWEPVEWWPIGHKAPNGGEGVGKLRVPAPRRGKS